MFLVSRCIELITLIVLGDAEFHWLRSGCIGIGVGARPGPGIIGLPILQILPGCLISTRIGIGAIALRLGKRSGAKSEIMADIGGFHNGFATGLALLGSPLVRVEHSDHHNAIATSNRLFGIFCQRAKCLDRNPGGGKILPLLCALIKPATGAAHSEGQHGKSVRSA